MSDTRWRHWIPWENRDVRPHNDEPIGALHSIDEYPLVTKAEIKCTHDNCAWWCCLHAQMRCPGKPTEDQCPKYETSEAMRERLAPE